MHWMYTGGFSHFSDSSLLFQVLMVAFCVALVFLAALEALTTTRRILRVSESDASFFERQGVRNPEDETPQEYLSEGEMIRGIIQGYLALEPELRHHIQEVGINTQGWSNGDHARCGGMVFRPHADSQDRFSGLRIEINQRNLSTGCTGSKAEESVFANALSGVVYSSCRETRERIALEGTAGPMSSLGPMSTRIGGIRGIG